MSRTGQILNVDVPRHRTKSWVKKSNFKEPDLNEANGLLLLSVLWTEIVVAVVIAVVVAVVIVVIVIVVIVVSSSSSSNSSNSSSSSSSNSSK